MSNEKIDNENEIYIGADFSKTPILNNIYSYENKDITFRGELKNYNYNALLKDKQTNINKFYELSAYYVNSDNIVSGIVTRVLTPFSVSNGFRLTGNDKTKQKYLDHYEAINFLDIARSIFYELYLFANCYIYIMPDGSIITLPPHRIRISDIMINGEPVIEFNIIELNNKRVTGVLIQNFMDTLVEKYKGYPPEITQQLQSGNSSAWVQLNPANTFVLQESKPMWQKYAIPFISTCLKPLAKKELISYYEDIQLNIGAKGFLHVKLGHDEILQKPTREQLNATAKIFQDALNKFPLAVTSHFIDAKFIAVDNKGLFDKSKYNEVNSQILSAGGISPLIVTGESEGGSFAQANISVETCAQRIKQNQDNFSQFMKKYNKRLAELWRVGNNRIPEFKFNEVNLTNDGKFKDEAFKLWQQGVCSTKTLLDTHNMDYEQELDRKKKETDSGDNLILVPPTNPFTNSNTPNNSVDSENNGRPEKDAKSLKRDKNNSQERPRPSTKS